MYFKTNQSVVIQAMNDYFSQKNELFKNATAFAKAYDAEPVITRVSEYSDFAGLKFNHLKDINFEVWTKPSRTFGESRLRAKAIKKANEVEWEREKEKWDDLYKVHFANGDKVSSADVYKSIGYGFGDHYFNTFKGFIHDGFLYIDTTYPKLTDCIEILGSEYETARLSFDLKQSCAKKMDQVA